ncbi:MAG: hypothetical protein ACJAVF_003885, partial [Paraglaciecola sp.]
GICQKVKKYLKVNKDYLFHPSTAPFQNVIKFICLKVWQSGDLSKKKK